MISIQCSILFVSLMSTCVFLNFRRLQSRNLNESINNQSRVSATRHLRAIINSPMHIELISQSARKTAGLRLPRPILISRIRNAISRR